MKILFPIRRLLALCLVPALAGRVVAAGPVGILRVKDGLLVHFDAAKGVGGSGGLPPANGARITRWGDQATDVQGDNVALPRDGGNGPFFLNSVPELNGRPAMEFRNGELMTATLSLSPSQSTWFVVFRADFSAEDRVIEFSQQWSTFVSPDSGGKVVARGWRVTNGSFPIDATLGNLASRKQEFFIQSARRSTPDTIHQRLIDRAGQVLTASATGSNATAAASLLAIGGQRPTGTIPYQGLLTGQIAEILVYNRSLTDAERQSVEAYLSWKFFGPADTDADSLPDEWEREKFGGLGHAAEGDADGDLLTNRGEFDAGTDPLAADTDGDGLDDSREVALGTSPVSADADGDLASDPIELLAGTDPAVAASKPAARFEGLALHGDFESVEAGRFTVRNLAGPGDAMATGGAPVFRAPGISGEGIRLDGTGAIDWGARPAATTDFTVGLAFRPDSAAGTRFLASQGNRDLTRPGWSILLENGALVVRAMNGSRSAAASFRHPGPLAADAWHHVSFTCDAAGMIVPYLNGSRAGWSPSQGKVPGGLAAGDGSTLLTGMSDDGTHGFAGTLDEFSLWSRVLGEGEIASLHATLAGGVGLDGKARNGAPAFAREPQPALVFAGQGFRLEADAPGALLQWRKNGGNLAGQTSAELLIQRAAAADAGRYSAWASFPGGIRPSAEARVTVADFSANQFLKTRANATGENELWIHSMAFDGDGLACGIPSFKPNPQGNQLGQVRFLRRSTANPDSWSVVQTINAPAGPGLYFGHAVAMEGDTLVVGAYRSNSFGENRYGRVFVYRRSSATSSWSLLQEIPSPVRGDNDNFGESIALEGNTLVVAASGDTKAFVYTRSGNTWTLQKTLSPAQVDLRTLVYGVVALQGDTLAIGEPYSSLNADNSQGVVHLYRRNQGGANQWGLVRKIKAPVPAGSDRFGSGVGLDGNVLAVGNPEKKTIEIYALDPATAVPAHVATLPRSQVAGVPVEQNTSFGNKIIIQGDYLLTSNAADSERGGGAGAAFLFRRDPGSTTRWTLLKKLAGNDIIEGSSFGSALAMQHHEIFVGATEAYNHPVDIGAIYGFRTLRDVIPEVITPPRTLADAGEPYRDEIACRVAAGASPVISAAGALPAWLSLQNLGGGRAVLSGTPPAGTRGDFPIRLRVTEPSSMPAAREFILHVSPGNLAPLVLRDPTLLAGVEDAAEISSDLREVFLDGEDGFAGLEFEVVSPARPDLFASVSVSRPGGFLVIQPAPDANGAADIVVRTLDRGALVSEAAFQVTVAAVNDPPQAAALPAITAGAAAPPLSRDLSPFFSDVDIAREGDLLAYSIVGNTAPELFSEVAVDPSSGMLDLAFAPYRSGTADLTIRATDLAGERADSLLRIIVPDLPPPVIDSQSTMVLNRQTGLLEQTFTFTNRGPRALGGFDLAIAGLPDGVTVSNASDATPGGGTIALRRPLGIGESVTIIVEYFAAIRGAPFAPDISMTVTLPELPPARAGQGFAIDRCLKLEDGTFLIEFPSVPGDRYEIQYSDNSVDWLASPTHIRAAGNRVQWIDRGPPRTHSVPPPAGSRFYRVKELPGAP
jgi:hypothetical protein